MLFSIRVNNTQEVELLLLHSTAKVDLVKCTLSPTLSRFQNGLYSKMADVAMAAAHLTEGLLPVGMEIVYLDYVISTCTAARTAARTAASVVWLHHYLLLFFYVWAAKIPAHTHKKSSGLATRD